MESSFQNMLQNYPHQNEKSGLKTRAWRLIILNSYGTCSKSDIQTQTPWLLSMFKSKIFLSCVPNTKKNLRKKKLYYFPISLMRQNWRKTGILFAPAHFIQNWWALRNRHCLLALRVKGLGKPQMMIDPKRIYFKTWCYLFFFPAFEKVTFVL